MLAGAICNGLNEGLLREELSLPIPSELDHARISVEDYTALLAGAQNSIEDELVGLLEKPVPNGSYATLCHLLIRCDNLEQAITHLDRFFSLFNNGRSIWHIRIKDGLCRISLQQLNEFQRQSPFYAQCMLLSVYKLMCWLSQQKFPLNSMGFAFPRAHYAANLAFLFDCPQQYQQKHSFIEFDADRLKMPIQQDEEAIQYFSDQYLVYLLIWSVEDSLESLIYGMVNQSLNEQELPDLDSIAAKLDMSSPTLSRRLQELGLSYQQIKDAVRRDLAIGLLKKRSLSIKEISDQLCFSEPSAFSRAFKQWMGVSPAQYLKSLE